MPNTSYQQLLNSPTAGHNWTGVAGTPLASSIAETIISPSGPDFSFVTNYTSPLYAGAVIRVTARGVYSTTATPTLQLQLRYGGVGGAVLLNTGAVTTISGAANTSWLLEAIITIRTDGATGTAWTQGHTIGIGGAATVALVPLSAPAAVTIDTTTAKALVLTGTWGTSSASNTITCHQFLIEGF